jgi:hypothetical protein
MSVTFVRGIHRLLVPGAKTLMSLYASKYFQLSIVPYYVYCTTFNWRNYIFNAMKKYTAVPLHYVHQQSMNKVSDKYKTKNHIWKICANQIAVVFLTPASFCICLIRDKKVSLMPLCKVQAVVTNSQTFPTYPLNPLKAGSTRQTRQLHRMLQILNFDEIT